MKSKAGFTLVELLIYVGLTAMIMGLFGAILVTVVRVQGEQGSSSQLGAELNFLMTSLKRHINEAIEIQFIDSGHLGVTKDLTDPPTTAMLEYDSDAKTIRVVEAGPSPLAEQISSARTSIDSLIFEKLQDPNNPASIAIRITITASVNTTNPGDKGTRTLQATAAPFLQSQ